MPRELRRGQARPGPAAHLAVGTDDLPQLVAQQSFCTLGIAVEIDSAYAVEPLCRNLAEQRPSR